MLASKLSGEPTLLAEALVATVRQPLLILDSALRVRAANSSFYKTFRVSPSETEGRLVFELGNGQWNIPLLRKLLEQILPERREVNDFEVSHRFHELGDRVMVLNARILVQSPDREPLIFLAVEDVTIRKAETLALEVSRDFAEGIIETLRDPLLILNPDLRVVAANAAYYAAFAYVPAETEGKRIYELSKGAWDIPELRDLLENTLAKNASFRDFEIDHVFPSIGQRILLLNGRRVHERGKKTERILLVLEDITDRRRQERFIRFQADALNRINDAVVAVDNDENITYWNSRAERLLKIPLAEAKGLRLGDVCKNLGEASEGLFTSGSDDRPWREYRLRLRGSDEEKCIESSATQLFEKDVNPTGRLIVLRDVTERKKAEIALRRTNEELELFTSIASHDLQEPLRMVAMYVGLLAKTNRGKLGPDADTHIRFVLDGTARMRSLIDDLLKLARIRTNPETFRRLSLRDVVDDALDDLQVAIKEGDAKVIIGELPEVLADEVQMRQVFQNLIGNAIKYRSHEKRPVITIGAEKRASEWVVSIQDNGLGFDMAHASHIFQLFRRLGPRDSVSGMGMGLTISKKIIESHGGRIWVESTPGVGSTFYFGLPC